jgi:serine/threonine protein kinase
VSYPTLEQYQEALQHPRTALIDPDLRAGTISTGGLGLPHVMCGGFALTYTISAGGKKYAVRCFHKQSPALEQRYRAISAKLAQIASPYFLPFEFQAHGVRIAGKTYPIVKMAWSNGDTLGDFVADNHRNGTALASLRNSLATLASYLESQNIAHGDIQPGNLMIDNRGRSIQLIDYDGMFVPDIQSLGAAEIGHRNFQHPQRSGQQFDPVLDRFSLICINVALKELEGDPKLWDETQSDSDSFLFRASDFSDPGASSVFQKLISKGPVSSDAKSLAAVCLGRFDQTPSLADFLVGKGIPQHVIAVKPKAAAPAKYASQYVVLNANDYASFLRNVGNMAELIGKVTDVKRGFSTHGRGAYVFINFADWRGEIVKLTIWSAALPKLRNQATESLVGSWVSVVGLVEPPYVSKRFRYSHISIDIGGPNQIKVISESDARFRLGAGGQSSSGPSTERNKAVIERLRGGAEVISLGSSARTGTSSRNPPTANVTILKNMQRSQVGQRAPQGGVFPQPPTRATKKSGGIPWWVWVAAILVLFALFRR